MGQVAFKMFVNCSKYNIEDKDYQNQQFPSSHDRM